MAEILVDSYSEANQSGGYTLSRTHPTTASLKSAAGQSFTCGSTCKITSAKFYLKKVGLPTGNAHVVLYAHSGTYGTNSVPTGGALATSDDFDVEDLTTNFVLYTFIFTGVEQYEMSADTKYCIVFQNPGVGTISSTNYVYDGNDNTDPTHDGNLCYFADSRWLPYVGRDNCFYVYGEEVGGEALTHSASDIMTISDSIATKSVMKYAKADIMTIGDAIGTKSVMKYAAADIMNINDALLVSQGFHVALADQMDISDSMASEFIAAEIKRRMALIKKIGLPTPQNVGVGS